MNTDANPLISKEFRFMDTLFNYPPPLKVSKTSNPCLPLFNLRILGFRVTMAEDIGALEACLALERAAGASPESAQTMGIFSPSAVPYCEFLMLRNGFGKLLAVTRLMRLGGANPILSPLETGRFHLSPLITALRYSRRGVVEMGSPAFISGCDKVKSTKLLWSGLIHYMKINRFGFVIGSVDLPKLENNSNDLSRLMETHGLDPDLESEALSRFRIDKLEVSTNRFRSEDASKSRRLPAGLHEALRRGCRLVAEPVLNQETDHWEFIWVSFREMLESGAF
jgi:hypothetical protein